MRKVISKYFQLKDSYFHKKSTGMKPTTEPAAQSEDPSAENNFPANGVEWVDCFVREMMTATSIDDARDRATRLLESLEKCISSRAGAEAAQNFHKVGTFNACFPF